MKDFNDFLNSFDDSVADEIKNKSAKYFSSVSGLSADQIPSNTEIATFISIVLVLLRRYHEWNSN